MAIINYFCLVLINQDNITNYEIHLAIWVDIYFMLENHMQYL